MKELRFFSVSQLYAVMIMSGRENRGGVAAGGPAYSKVLTGVGERQWLA